MSLIQFENMEPIKTTLSYDLFNRILITFCSTDDVPDDSILVGGFKELNEHNFLEQADHSDMNYIYRKFEDGLTYILTSNENDVYIEPIIPDPPVIDEYIPTIDEIRRLKISELSSICNNLITNGVCIDINGTMEHFSYTDEDQVNIKELFDLALQTNVPMYYHSDGNSCKLYTVEQIANLYISAATNKMHHITYYNQLKMYIQSLDDIETISSVEYGHELSGEYLEVYNSAMAQARIGMETLLKAR